LIIKRIYTLKSDETGPGKYAAKMDYLKMDESREVFIGVFNDAPGCETQGNGYHFRLDSEPGRAGLIVYGAEEYGL